LVEYGYRNWRVGWKNHVALFLLTFGKWQEISFKICKIRIRHVPFPLKFKGKLSELLGFLPTVLSNFSPRVSTYISFLIKVRTTRFFSPTLQLITPKHYVKWIELNIDLISQQFSVPAVFNLQTLVAVGLL
jgi:hypothetical protein